jgi:hypothetical protein
VKHTQRYTIDGVTYQSLDEMPLHVRKKWDSVTALLRGALGNATDGPDQLVGRASIKFEQTIVRHETDSAVNPDEPSPWGASPIGSAASLDASIQDDAREPRDKRLSLGFCILFFPIFSLALLTQFSSVKTTIQYGATWITAWAAWMLLLSACAWGMRDRLYERFFPRNNASLGEIFVQILAGGIGLGVLAAYAIFGGVPILAHHLTAHQGELTVTVIGKDSSYQRGSCRPRLKIAEFTFFLHDHICPSDRAFGEIGVGARIRLQGQVSPFGISVDRFSWKVNESR